MSVVIVDDSEVFLESASDLLARQGMDVVGTATTPAAALARVRETAPDLVVIDLHLGSASGLDLAGLLSADGAGAPALVLVSSIGLEDLAALALGAPVQGYLTKTDLSAAALESIVRGTPLAG
jgi:two-component system, NarL family, nitrate/nitrite response regulator NarL